MNYVRVKSYAKINLTLDICGRSGAYHNIDSLVASIDICDLITAKKRRGGQICVTMHGFGSENIPPEENNARKAGEAFKKVFNCGGAEIEIWKNIPVGAGLGGSSADASGVISAMAQLYDIKDYDAVEAVAAGIGSDCPYMLRGGFARISGRGEIVEQISSSVRLDLALLIPHSGTSTAQCYAKSDLLPPSPPKTEEAVRALLNADKAALGAALGNGLYAAASSLCPETANAYSDLQEFAPLGVNMSGSGSSVYALFENDQFVQYAKSRYRGGCTFIQTKTITPYKEEKLWLKKD